MSSVKEHQVPSSDCLYIARSMAEASSAAQHRWELENNIQAVDLNLVESFFRYNQAEQQAIQQQKPWAKDPHLFKQ